MSVIGSATHATLPIMRRSSTPKRGKTTSDNRKQTAPPLAAAELGRVTAGYQLWLVRQPLSPNTRRTYLGRVRQYCAYLRASGNDYGNPLSDLHARDYAIRDFKSHLKKSRKAKPATVNLTLAALDNLYLFLGLGRPNVRREDLPKEAPRALEPEEQKRFMRAVERCTSIRDRAIALLLFYTALRVGECASLDTNDIALSARKGKVTVRAGKGDLYREVVLNAEAREGLSAWLVERGKRFPDHSESALFLNSHGQRLSIRSIDLTLRRLGKEANVAVSAHRLRHSCLTNLVRRGHDLVLVAEIAGHNRIETTRRYSLPTERDREAAMESLRMEY
jgi:site-specific recombinase XerD